MIIYQPNQLPLMIYKKLLLFLLVIVILREPLMAKSIDTSLAEKYIQRSSEFMYDQFDSANYYANLAFQFAGKEDSRTLRRALSLQGLIYNNQNKPLEAIPWFERAAAMAFRLKDTLKGLEMYDNAGITLRDAGRYVESIRRYISILKIAEHYPDRGIHSDILNNLGVAFQSLYDAENAVNYLKKSLLLAQQIQDEERILKVKMNLGSSYAAVHRNQISNQYLWDVIRAYPSLSDNPEVNMTLMDAYQNVATNYFEEKQFDSCIWASRKAMSYRDFKTADANLGGIYQVLASAYLGKNQTIEAGKIIDTLRSNLRIEQNPEYLVSFYRILYEYHYQRGEHSLANDAIHKSIFYRDSIAHVAGSLGSQKEIIRYEIGQKAQADSLRLSSKLLEAQLKAKANQNWLLLTITLGVIAIAGASIYFLRSRNLKKENQLIANEKKLAEYNLSVQQLKTLQAQMNPHFIFNCFNTIDSYILQNKKLEATQLIHSFSKLTRRILEHTARNEISLSEEIETLESYLSTEQLRNPNKFDWEITIDPNTTEVKIPPMLLQPFVENAVIHGIRPLTDRHGMITISGQKENSSLVINIVDNGVGRKNQLNIPKQGKRLHQSMSMEITKERIAALFGNKNHEHSIQIIDGNEDNPGTIVRLKLPLKT